MEEIAYKHTTVIATTSISELKVKIAGVREKNSILPEKDREVGLQKKDHNHGRDSTTLS